MAPSCQGRCPWDWLWFVAWGVASSVWCVTTACAIGPTFDEPLYIARGLECWRTGSHAGLMRIGTMPLPIDLETLPLYLWERWHGEAFNAERDLDALLPWARAGTLVFWWLLLFYGRLIGRLLGGPWAGRLAVALLACEPSFLAHASLATTDIALTACVLALVYHFQRGRDAGWVRRRAVPALWFGAAVLAKASGLVYGTIALLVIEMDRLARAGALACPAGTGGWARLRHGLAELGPLRRDLGWIIGGGMALVFVYCRCDWSTQPSFVAWAHGLEEGQVRSALVWVADHLCIFTNAGEGLVRQIKHNMHGHGVYVLGRSDLRSFWYYFPVVLAIKLSVPLLLAPVLIGLVRPRALLNWACLATAVLVVCSLKFQVQIGVRLVLPLVALGVVGLSAALVSAAQECGTDWKRGLLMASAALALCWTTQAAVAAWPNGLCYTNELWGGKERAHLVVSDGNYDWGQGLPELARWQRDHGVAPLAVWYFGTDPAIKRPPFTYRSFEYMALQRPEDVAKALRGCYLAASTTLLYGCAIDHQECRPLVTYLRTCTPVGRTTTFFIYNFTNDFADAPVNMSCGRK
jgi:Dolichyl-phosphate-mannose-protein mannosyltransferase